MTATENVETGWGIIRNLEADLLVGGEPVALTLQGRPAAGLILEGISFQPKPPISSCLQLAVDEVVAPTVLMQHMLNSMSFGYSRPIRLQQYREGSVAWLMTAKVESIAFTAGSDDMRVGTSLVLEVRDCRRDAADKDNPTTETATTT